MESFAYFPHTGEDVRRMLERVGVPSIDALYADVPPDFLYKGEYDLPDAMSEQQLRDRFESLAARNPKLTVFVGAGCYDHYSPAVASNLVSRSEFLTAYTPYQSEISQGTLRYIFEYQSMVCALTGMDVSNASMYDGPTAAAEAMLMAVACTRGKNTFLLSRTLLPGVLEVAETYAAYHGVHVEYVESDGGQTSVGSLARLVAAGDVAGALLPSVNRYGIVEDLSGCSDILHGDKALLAVYCDPSALAVVKTPGEWGADIAVGDGQSLGLPMMFGGPSVGFMACRQAHMRKLPGRIVGQTADAQGRRAYVLTLQAREQHIRREKATSNICSNESLMALYVTIYLSLMGPRGMRELNAKSYSGAHYLYGELLGTGKFEPVFDRPFLKEFVLRPLVDAKVLRERLYAAGYFAALPTEEGYVSFCVTEKRTRAEMDALVAVIRGIQA